MIALLAVCGVSRYLAGALGLAKNDFALAGGSPAWESAFSTLHATCERRPRDDPPGATGHPSHHVDVCHDQRLAAGAWRVAQLVDRLYGRHRRRDRHGVCNPLEPTGDESLGPTGGLPGDRAAQTGRSTASG